MGKMNSGQAILVGLILVAVSIVVVDIWRLLSADLASAWAAHQLTGGLLPSLPYIGAAGMLPLALVKRMPQARRAVVGFFGVFIVGGILWWVLFAEIPMGLPRGQIVFTRLCRFVLMPVAYVAALYLPGVTRYLGWPNEDKRANKKEVSQ